MAINTSEGPGRRHRLPGCRDDIIRFHIDKFILASYDGESKAFNRAMSQAIMTSSA